MRFVNKLMPGYLLFAAQIAFAHGPVPSPLTDADVPPVPGLVDGPDPIVVDKDMAIALGKALFWDINVGSDGMACGSCHFHAGADVRVKNQLNPGDKSSKPTGQIFNVTASGLGGANHTLNRDDFPFHRFNNPFDRNSGVAFSSDDVAASSGTFSGEFTGVSRLSGMSDDCSREVDPVFHVNNVGTRRVEPRNAPTVINAVFNHRNFWDGRANNIFNGSSPWGDRDPNAGVWVKVNARNVEKQRLRLENSSLASLSVGPPLDSREMSCRNRTWPDIGRKLLSRKPLQYQKVHHEDSVFAPLNLTLSSSESLQSGLNTTYKDMVKKSFNQKYWSFSRTGPFGSRPGQQAYDQAEANFSMFFGIALQLYQATLISDQAPIDTCPRDPVTFEPLAECIGESAKRGIAVMELAHCNLCHAGPTLSTAAVVTNAMIIDKLGPNGMGPFSGAASAGINKYGNTVIRDTTQGGLSSPKLMDFGYFNTGVADPDGDPGVGGLDDFGNPLSLAAQYVEYLAGETDKVLDEGVTTNRACDFIAPLSLNIPFNFGDMFTALDGLIPDPNGTEGCLIETRNYIPTVQAAQTHKNGPKLGLGTKAAFKVPTLRNIELTGPYMHNGSMATLEEVVEFYSRGGNFDNPQLHGLQVALPLSTNAQAREDLIALMKSFTDERVRYEKAPFDHPEIMIPNGHVGDRDFVTAGHPLHAEWAKDEFLVIPAVGANGSIEPLLPFEALLDD